MDMKSFLGKEKEYVINGEKIVLKPLGVEYADLAFDLVDEDKKKSTIKALVEATLKESGLKVEYDLSSYLLLANAVLDINGLAGGSKDAKKP